MDEPSLKLSTKGTKVVVHNALDLESVLKIVQFLDRLDASGVELIASGAEDILDDVAILESIINSRRGSQYAIRADDCLCLT